MRIQAVQITGSILYSVLKLPKMMLPSGRPHFALSCQLRNPSAVPPGEWSLREKLAVVCCVPRYKEAGLNDQKLLGEVWGHLGRRCDGVACNHVNIRRGCGAHIALLSERGWQRCLTFQAIMNAAGFAASTLSFAPWV